MADVNDAERWKSRRAERLVTKENREAETGVGSGRSNACHSSPPGRVAMQPASPCPGRHPISRGPGVYCVLGPGPIPFQTTWSNDREKRG